MTTPESGWPGIVLRRSREGVFWVVHVPAAGTDLESMQAAVEVARQIDRELTAAYPRRRARSKPVEAEKPRVHPMPKGAPSE